MADPFFVILVSGDPKGRDQGFARCAWLRVGELVAQFFGNRKKPGAVVTEDTVLCFIHFDCHTGSVLIYEHDFKKRKGTVKDPTASARNLAGNWKKLDANYMTEHASLIGRFDPRTFVEWQPIAPRSDANPNPVSIVNVYHSVRKAPPGSVLELSIFSHAFVDGPVLFNTSANRGTRRDPLDTDGRANIDFQPDMGEDGVLNIVALQQFEDAFAVSGTFRVWGCNIQDVVVTLPPPDDPHPGVARRCLILSTVRQVVEAAYTRSLKLRNALDGQLRDPKQLPPGNTKITLDMGREIRHERELQSDKNVGHSLTHFSTDRLFEIRYQEQFGNHAYHTFFPRTGDDNNRFPNVMTRSLSDIVKFVAKETTPSYLFAAAKALPSVTVVGGAPGTSAEIGKDRQQFIPRARLYEAKFFSKFFGADITEPGAGVQRHYAFFDQQVVRTIEERAANGLP